ncbi:hypothetical protein [Streptomyces sp. IBSBF 2435]|uniref:hypothetical protein n=1 Tax=Streptomyces sp. IBSBF 2435 TaxID=2903531 RepID=UPI002FDC42F3
MKETGHSPRQALRRQLDRMAAVGVGMQVAIETEWLLPQEIRLPGTTGRAGAGDSSDPLVDLLVCVIGTLDEIGLPVGSVRSGSHPWRIETALSAREPMTACEQHRLCGRAFAALGSDPRWFPFHADPGAAVPAGAMRLRLSLVGGEPSVTAGLAITGLREVLPDLAEMYLPGDAEPTLRKRVAALATVSPLGCGDDTRLEVRVPVPGRDLHLLLAAVVTGVLHGLGHEDCVHSGSACTTELRRPADPSAGRDALLGAPGEVGPGRSDHELPVTTSPVRGVR